MDRLEKEVDGCPGTPPSPPEKLTAHQFAQRDMEASSGSTCRQSSPKPKGRRVWGSSFVGRHPSLRPGDWGSEWSAVAADAPELGHSQSARRWLALPPAGVVEAPSPKRQGLLPRLKGF